MQINPKQILANYNIINFENEERMANNVMSPQSNIIDNNDDDNNEDDFIGQDIQ